MNEQINVQKADGRTEPFDEAKLRASLKETEADEAIIENVISHIKDEIHPEVKTADIYKHARSQLKRHGGPYAARYSLRESVSDLGPTGYPFEHFVAQIFEAYGFKTAVGVHVDGTCIDHEVDVVGTKEDEIIIVEAKFHNEHSIKSDVKTALYVNARFNDLHKNSHGELRTEGKEVTSKLITNTKFTTDAIEYSECAGLHLIGWKYPNEGSLEDLIYDANLEPVTALTNLNNRQKKQLLKNQVVLCKDLRNNQAPLAAAGLTAEEIASVMEEVEGICHL